MIRFSGEKERSGWDWADLILKVSVPVLILGLGAGLNKCTSDREERLARQQRDSAVVTAFTGEMQKLVVANRLRPGQEISIEDRVLPREMIIAALAQLNSDEAYPWRNHVIRFARGLTRLRVAEGVQEGGLLEEADLSNLNLKKASLNRANLSDSHFANADLREAYIGEAILNRANLNGADLSMSMLSRSFLVGVSGSGVNLSKAWLDGADLSKSYLIKANFSGTLLVWTDFIEANLNEANFNKANLSGADLRRADLSGANFSGARLGKSKLFGSSEANLSGADLNAVRWDGETQWPGPIQFKGAKNIPSELKMQLGLP